MKTDLTTIDVHNTTDDEQAPNSPGIISVVISKQRKETK